jgi:hypothetical protein
MAEAITGQDVASNSASGAQKPGRTLLDGLARGLGGLIDVEVAKRAAAASTPDRADVANAIKTNAPRSGAAVDVLRNLTPVQWAGLALVGVLGIGLAAGWFRR